MTEVEIAVGITVMLVATIFAVSVGVAKWMHEPEPSEVESTPPGYEPDGDGGVKKLRSFKTQWLGFLILMATSSLFSQTPLTVAPGFGYPQDFPRMAHPSVCGGQGASCVVSEIPSTPSSAATPDNVFPHPQPVITTAESLGIVILPRNYDCGFVVDHWVCSEQPEADPQAGQDSKE